MLVGSLRAVGSAGGHFADFFRPPDGESTPAEGVLHATALMFVAFTGYGRIAMLGEEAREPRWTIPAAIIVTLILSMGLYLAVGAVGIGTVGAPRFAAATKEAGAPLDVVARELAVPGLPWILAVGAITAMLGVLLNLILGLSRVLLAMGRRKDMPAALARVDARTGAPTAAVDVTGLAIASLVLIGNVKTTWSFSAFTVLVYYAITNLSAIRMPPEARRYPVWAPMLGVAACMFLAFWVDTAIWAVGLAMIALGLVWHTVARRLARGGDESRGH